MAGDLSEDSKFVTMSFEDSHRLVTTMRMAELILNDTVHSDRKHKIAQIKAQLDAEHCPDMSTLCVARACKGPVRPYPKTLIPIGGSF